MSSNQKSVYINVPDILVTSTHTQNSSKTKKQIWAFCHNSQRWRWEIAHFSRLIPTLAGKNKTGRKNVPLVCHYYFPHSLAILFCFSATRQQLNLNCTIFKNSENAIATAKAKTQSKRWLKVKTKITRSLNLFSNFAMICPRPQEHWFFLKGYLRFRRRYAIQRCHKNTQGNKIDNSLGLSAWIKCTQGLMSVLTWPLWLKLNSWLHPSNLFRAWF